MNSKVKKQDPNQKWFKKIVNFLGLKKNIVALLTMVILVGLGEKMAERFLPLYLVALGGGAFAVGLLNGFQTKKTPSPRSKGPQT